jgi:hypothetical protein
LTITIQNPAQDMLTNRRDIGIQFMSNKNLASTRVRLPFGCHYLAVLLSIIGITPAVLAQPSSITFNDSISFSGQGTLPVSQTSYSDGNAADDPIASVVLSGTGTVFASQTAPGSSQYNVTTSFNTIATVAIAGVPGTFSASQPYYQHSTSGSDPGLQLSTVVPAIVTSSSTAPFYGLFPPQAGTDPTGTIATTGQQSNFPYPSGTYPVLSVGFGAATAMQAMQGDTNDGSADLYFGSTPIMTAILDPTNSSDELYTFTYTGTELYLSANISLADPTATFTGTAVITIVEPIGVPDSSAGAAGILTLLGVCAAGAWQKARMRFSMQPIRRG